MKQDKPTRKKSMDSKERRASIQIAVKTFMADSKKEKASFVLNPILAIKESGRSAVKEKDYTDMNDELKQTILKQHGPTT